MGKALVCILMAATTALVVQSASVSADGNAATSKDTATTNPPAIDYEAHISAGETPPPAGQLKNPFSGDPKVAKTGEAMFSQMNCDGCHGIGATGAAAPSLADGRWRYGGADNEIFQTIYFGRPKGMPAFGGLLSTDDIWSVVTYLKSLPAPPNDPTQSWVGK